MKKIICFLLLILSITVNTSANASLADCKNLYVGRIVVENGGLNRFILLAVPSATYGSYWINTSTLSADEQAMILSILLTAKSTQTTVTVTTNATDSCSISSGFQDLNYIEYGNTP